MRTASTTRTGGRTALSFPAIPLVWKPVHFTFVLGSYNVDMPKLILFAALLVVVKRGVDRLQAEAALASPQGTSGLAGNHAHPGHPLMNAAALLPSG